MRLGRGGWATRLASTCAFASSFLVADAEAAPTRAEVHAHAVFDRTSAPEAEVEVEFDGPVGPAHLELLRVDRGVAVLDRVVVPVDVARDARRVGVLVRTDANYRVRLVRGAEVLDEAHVSVERAVSPTIATLDVLVPTPNCPSCVSATMAVVGGRFPRSTLSYGGVVVLAASPRALSALTPETCGPLRDWVHGGGSLVVVGTDAAADLPCDLGRMPVLAPRARMAHRNVGQGRVTRVETTASSPVLTTDEMNALYSDALGRTTRPRQFGNYARFIDRVPGAHFAASSLFISVLALATGPLLHAYLRRRRRLEHALVVVPVASVLGLASVLAFAHRVAPAPHEVRVASLELASGERHGRASIVHGFVSPKTPVRARPSLAGALVTADVPARWTDGASFRVTEDGAVVLGEGLTGPVDYVDYTETAWVDVPGPVTVACDEVSCSVRNETGVALEGAWLDLPARDRIYFGRVEERATVSLAGGTRAPHPDDERAFADFFANGWSPSSPRPVTLHAVQTVDGATRSLRVTCAFDCAGAT